MPVDNDGVVSRARAWINEGVGRWITVVVTVLAIAGATWGGIHLFNNAGLSAVRKIQARGKRVLYVCRKCGSSGQVRVDYDAKPPVVCPDCGSKEGVPGFRCMGCKRIIPDQQGIFRCPHCNRLYDLSGRPTANPTPAPRR